MLWKLSRIFRSFHDLIRPQQQRRRDREAEGFRGLEVDDELELGWLLHGQVTRSGAFEDLVHINSGASKQVNPERPIGHEAPVIDEISYHVHRRQPMLGRKIHEPSSLADEQDAGQHGQCLGARCGHFREGPGKVFRPSTRFDELQALYSKRPCRAFYSTQDVLLRVFRVIAMPESCEASTTGYGLR